VSNKGLGARFTMLNKVYLGLLGSNLVDHVEENAYLVSASITLIE
jgi:GTP:adenosylcobinamide-phosphate guanylyltransferase